MQYRKKNQFLDDFEMELDQKLTTTSISNIGKWLSICSFLIGTGLFLSAMFLKYIDELFAFGLMFIIAAFFLNLVFFIVLLFAGTNPREKSINQKMALKMLINVPIVIFYIIILGTQSPNTDF